MGALVEIPAVLVNLLSLPPVAVLHLVYLVALAAALVLPVKSSLVLPVNPSAVRISTTTAWVMLVVAIALAAV